MLLVVLGVVLSVLGLLVLLAYPLGYEQKLDTEGKYAKNKVEMVGGVILALGLVLLVWAFLAHPKVKGIKKSSSLHPSNMV